MMQQWSQNKAKMEKEMNRRIESATYGNRFRDLEMKQRENKEKDYKEINKVLNIIKLDSKKASRQAQ